MNENEITVPIYLITGFLEAGKTSFLKFTMEQPYFRIPETTLLINCESGVEEYDAEKLRPLHTVCESVSRAEDLTYTNLRAMSRRHDPARVIIEYNALWGMKKLREMRLPKGWGIVQEIVVADASTFQIYMNNMKSYFVEMSQEADMVLFNRCSKELPLSNFRRSIKVVNPGCDVQYMGADGKPIDIFEENPPFDIHADIIEIDDVDYGIFFVDVRETPDRYKGKKVRFRGQILKSREIGADFFVPARQAMTCCADDIQYIGYLCRSEKAPQLAEGDWVTVTARLNWEFLPMAQGEEPVLNALEIEPAEPPAEELVYFN